MSSEIDKSLKETLLSSALPALLNEYGEIAFDTLTNDELIKQIPLLSTIHAIGKTYSSVRDYRFAKKMMLFISSMQTLSQAEREKLVHKIENDSSHAENIGEVLADLIAKIDGNKKPLLVAEALKLYARSEINSQELMRLNNAIDRFLLCDIEFLKSRTNGYIIEPDADNAAAHNLLNSGLAYEVKLYAGSKIEQSNIGRLFLTLLDNVEKKI